MKKLYYFIKSNSNEKKILCLLIINIIFAATKFILPEVFRYGIRAIETGSMADLGYTVFLVILSIMLYIPLEPLLMIQERKVKNECEKNIQLKLLNKAFELPKYRRNVIDVGTFLSKSIQNTMESTEYVIDSLVHMICGFATVILCLVYMSLLQWKVTLILTFFFLLWRLLVSKLSSRMNSNATETVDAKHHSNSFLLNIFHNMMTIKNYRCYNYFNDKWFALEKNVYKKSTKQNIWLNGMQDGTWAMVKISEFLIIYGIGSLFVYYGYMETGALLSLTFSVDILAKGIELITTSIGNRTLAESNIDKINEFLEDNVSEQGITKDINGEEIIINVQNLYFSYNDKVIFKNVNFCILPGEHVLITGNNGEGKSTLLNLLCGLYRPNHGKIYYGSTDTSSICIHSLSQKYAYISQENNIAYGNIFENVALDNVYDKNKILNILKKFNMLNTISTPPINLSQGEKQRINIARALYRSQEVSILFADEAFANIDDENTARILNTLKEEYKNKTMVFVAHTDLHIKFDKILTVTNGTVHVSESRN